MALVLSNKDARLAYFIYTRTHTQYYIHTTLQIIEHVSQKSGCITASMYGMSNAGSDSSHIFGPIQLAMY